jgi:hypothetical protein
MAMQIKQLQQDGEYSTYIDNNWTDVYSLMKLILEMKMVTLQLLAQMDM